MNQQKLNELAVQAGAYWREGYAEQPNGDHVWREKVKVDIVDMDLNKFAELIVRECVAICNDTNDASYLNGVIAGRKIKEHFGVER